MHFERHIPRIEAILYAYATMKLETPEGMSFSQALAQASELGTRITSSRDRTSPQERWAVKYARELRDAAAIETAKKEMDERERQLIEMRYIERRSMQYIAKKLHVGISTAYRIRDRALRVVAMKLNLLDAA